MRNVAIVAVILLLLGGCGRDQAKGPVEIIYWTGWSGHELDCQRKLIDRFNRAHPNIRVKALSVAGSYQKVRIAIAGGDTPDVCSAVWADELAGYAMRGALTPLDSFFKQSGRRADDFMPGNWAMLHYNGRLWGLAATTNSTFIAYNRDIFRESGLDVRRPPSSIAELDDAAWKATRLRPDGGYERYGFRPTSLVLWAYVFGGRWYDPVTRKVTANNPRNVAALRWLASYGKRYDISRMEAFEKTFGSQSTVSGPFFVSKIGMWGTGEWAEEHIRRYAPGLNWGYFPLPYPPGGRANCGTVGASVFVIPAACKHKKEAWEFLNWICGPEASKQFCLDISNIPPMKSAAYSPEFQREPLLRFAVKLVSGPNSFGPPQMPIWPYYQGEITRVEDYAIHNAGDPQKLLDDLNTRMQKELGEALQEAVY